MALLDFLTGRADDASESKVICSRLETATAGALWSAQDTSTVVAMCSGDYSRTGFVSAHACPARVVLPAAALCLRPRLHLCVGTRRLGFCPPGSGLGPACAQPGRQARASGWGFIRGVTRQLFGAVQMRSRDERRPIDPPGRSTSSGSEADALALLLQAKEDMAIWEKFSKTAAYTEDPVTRDRLMVQAELFYAKAINAQERAAELTEWRPVRRVLKKLQYLRQPGVDKERSPPDFSRIFDPYPRRTDVELGRVVEMFWDETVSLVTDSLSGEGGDSIPAGRLPLTFLVSSFGRGKTLILREAARFLHADTQESDFRTSRPVKGRGVVVFAANFNGSFRVSKREEVGLAVRQDEANQNFYMLLHVRMLYNELADLKLDPMGQFDAFIKKFYKDYAAGEFSCDDVLAEVEELVETRAGRGTRSDVAVLLVDEIGKLRVGHAEATCARLGVDIPYLIRSESCTLMEVSPGLGVAVFTAMESSLMLAERSASGRNAVPIDCIPEGDLMAQIPRLVESMRLAGALHGGKGSAFNSDRLRSFISLNVGGRDVDLQANHAAEVLVRLGGLVWRSVELLALQLRQDPHSAVLTILFNVEKRLVADSSSIFFGLSSFWGAENVHLRDHVLAATFLPDRVAEQDRVIPASDISSMDAVEAVADDTADAHVADGSAAEVRQRVLKKRLTKAGRVWDEAQCFQPRDLTWGDLLSLGIITANRGSALSPKMIPMSLLRALDDDYVAPSSNMWDSLQEILYVATAVAEDQRDSDGNELRCTTKFDWCGWELFLLYWERLISAARALRPGKWGSVTLKELYGRRSFYMGKSALLSTVLVDATVERTAVVYLAGAGEQQAGTCSTTLEDVLGGKVPPDTMLRTVYKLRNGEEVADGVCFYRSLKDVPDVVRKGELVAVFLQAKHSKLEASTKSGPDLQKSQDRLEKDGDAPFGVGKAFDVWRPRSVLLCACMRDVHLRDGVLRGPFGDSAVVLSKRDLEELLGTTMFCIARALYLLLPPQVR